MNQLSYTGLVSIIVPAYNVDRYIEKCILSILSQSYENIQVIVVDDGSTDSTSAIIDGFHYMDDRLIVFHVKNNGVSAARNIGIENADGDYILFVDADDYVATDFVEYMVSLAITSGSDFCFTKKCFTRSNESQDAVITTKNVSPEVATAMLISPDIIVGCWNKIFKKSFIDENNLRFSTSLFYGEGLTFITTAAQIAKSVCVGNRKVYFYRINNPDSATSTFDINKIYNGEIALLNIRKNLIIKTPLVLFILDYHICLYNLSATLRLMAHSVEYTYIDDFNRWKNHVKNNYHKFLFSNKLSLYRKLLLLFGVVSPRLLMWLDIHRRKRIAKSNI